MTTPRRQLRMTLALALALALACGDSSGDPEYQVYRAFLASPRAEKGEAVAFHEKAGIPFIFNPKGDEALFYATFSSMAEFGHGSLIHLKKRFGRWRVREIAAVWVYG